MSSNQPQRAAGDMDPYKLSSRGNIMQASRQVNRFARRDAALYPLSFLLVGTFAAMGYFLMDKSMNPNSAERRLSQGVVNPWKDEDKHETSGSAAEWKYRYKTREGHMEDGYPAMNQDVRVLKEGKPHKYHT